MKKMINVWSNLALFNIRKRQNIPISEDRTTRKINSGIWLRRDKEHPGVLKTGRKVERSQIPRYERDYCIKQQGIQMGKYIENQNFGLPIVEST